MKNLKLMTKMNKNYIVYTRRFRKDSPDIFIAENFDCLVRDFETYVASQVDVICVCPKRKRKSIRFGDIKYRFAKTRIAKDALSTLELHTNRTYHICHNEDDGTHGDSLQYPKVSIEQLDRELDEYAKMRDLIKSRSIKTL
jgi:hypothetical protein